MPIIKGFEKLTDLKWLNLFNVSYVDKSGDNKVWTVASRGKEPKCVTDHFNKPDAVVIVSYHIGLRKLVLTREYRVPLGDYEYGLAAGLVDEGETAETASRRELKEETGLDVTRFLKVGPPVYSSAGLTDESVSMVYVECDGEPTTDGNESSEDIEVLLVTQEEAAELCNRSTLKFDAKAWLVLSDFAAQGYDFNG